MLQIDKYIEFSKEPNSNRNNTATYNIDTCINLPFRYMKIYNKNRLYQNNRNIS